jgi:hypothetical protein
VAVIDKLEAAERLIVAGIGMSERGEDPLAIHVVASSTLSLLRELIQANGDNYAARVLKEGLFHAASFELAGKPVPLPTTPEIDALIHNVAAGINGGQIKTSDDIKVTLNTDELRDLLAYIIRPFNFLKHAQRDPLATLDDDDVDPQGTIIHALTAYGMLRPTQALPDTIAPFLAKHGLL